MFHIFTFRTIYGVFFTNIIDDKLLLNFGAKFQPCMATFLDTINKSKTHDGEPNLSPMMLKGNEMVYSWN